MGLMESVLSTNETHGVPLTVEAKLGKNWEEMSPFETKK